MIYDKHIASRFDVVKSVSSITHAHTRSVLACFYYLEFARLLLQGKDKKAAYCILQEEIPAFLHSINIPKTEFDIFKKEISEAEDHEAKLLEKEAEYSELFANPYTAAQRGFIDEVILPKDTRKKLIKAFSMLENKVVATPNRKHGNIPL